MKTKTLLVTVFAIGVVSGVFAHRSLVKPPCPQSAPVTLWQDTEEDTRARMLEFQLRLEKLETQTTPDSVDRLSKEMEAQRGIDDILIKYREAQQAKFAPFLAGGVAGSILTFLTAWVKRTRTSRKTPGRLPG
jgi:hypothetical protein